MKLSALKKRCYVPYSQTPEIAIVQSQNDAWFPGVRVENISFPITISALQNALFCCLSEGEKPKKIFTDSEASDALCSQLQPKVHVDSKQIQSLDEVSFTPLIQSFERSSIHAQLQHLLDNPWVPYSDFPVAAFAETNGQYIGGINIELPQWNLGLCAERVALAKAISYGLSDVDALHLTTLHGDYNSPCGACRQVISEHMEHQPVFMYNNNGNYSQLYSSDLLPYNFQSTKLHKHNRSNS